MVKVCAASYVHCNEMRFLNCAGQFRQLDNVTIDVDV